MGSYFLLQGIFLTQGLNPHLLHCRQTLNCLSYQGSSNELGIWVINKRDQCLKKTLSSTDLSVLVLILAKLLWITDHIVTQLHCLISSIFLCLSWEEIMEWGKKLVSGPGSLCMLSHGCPQKGIKGSWKGCKERDQFWDALASASRCNKLPQALWLKITHIYSLTVGCHKS